MYYKKIYEVYTKTTGKTPKEKALEIYNIIHGNSEYGWLKDAPIEWIEHRIETGEIKTWNK